MRQLRLLLFALLTILVPACGAGGDGDDGTPDSGRQVDDNDGGGGDPSEPAYDPDPPPGTATFFVNHNSGGNDVPPGDKAKGFANAYTTTGLLDQLQATGTAGGLFRRDLCVNTPYPNVPASIQEAKRIGLNPWLTVMGTPEEMSPSTVGEEYRSGLPPYARWTPINIEEWVDLVVGIIESYEANHDALPEYVEIWNEPDRVEFYNEDINDYLRIYEVASVKIKNRWPSIKIGGMGLAGYSSTMGGTESAILSLINHAVSKNLPLDFVSWHHYTIANELVHSGFVDTVRSRLASFNLSNVELIVSEWNIYPTALGYGPEFDGSHSAANYAGFQTTARNLGLDGNIMFMLQDPNWDSGQIDDFTGQGMGAITSHGIKKPVFRVIETMQSMASEPMLHTISPEGELSVNVYATKMGNRIRYAVSNDNVPGDWIWANYLRDAGFAPGELWPLYFRAANIGHKHKPTEQELLDVGMTADEVAAVKSIEGELNKAWHFINEPRPVEIIFGGQEIPDISNVQIFNADENNYSSKIQEIMPIVENTEDNARWHALTEASAFLSNNGIQVSPGEFDLYDSIEDWITENNIPSYIASEALIVYQKAFAEARMFDEQLLNSLPQFSPTPMSAEEGGITGVEGSLHFFMEPNSVVIFDVNT